MNRTRLYLVSSLLLTACGAPDGGPPSAPEELVIASDRDGAGTDMYLHTLGAEGFVRLTDDAGNDYGPAWSPGGDRILFDSDVDGNPEIYAIAADGTGRVNLTRFDGYDGGGHYSPDGTEIVFTSTREAVAEAHAGRDIWVMDADGANVRRLTTNDMYEGAPRFSPDGARIAFCRSLPPETEGGNANGEIFVMNRDGSGERRLTDKEGFDCLADWSPDGERLAFHGCEEAGCFLFVVPADGGDPTRIDLPHSANWPMWSPNGEWIAYTASHDDQTDIWVVRPDGSENRRVTDHPGRDEVAAWRPPNR